MGPLSHNRRRFLQFLAASPLVSQAWPQPAAPLVASARDALDVMDLEAVARKTLLPAHWGYLSTGTDDDATIRANLKGFAHFGLRPRRLVDSSKPDLHIELFGTVWDSPIFLCPAGAQKTYFEGGEVTTARAIKGKNTLMMLANTGNCSTEDVTQALGRPPWYQMYLPRQWDETEKMVRQIEEAGCPVIAWTIDNMAGRNMETFLRATRMPGQDCASCHSQGMRNGSPINPPRPMLKGFQSGTNPATASWSDGDRLRKLTKLKLVFKGIETAEDARLCLEHGADAVVVSNHGGRGTNTGRATIDCLVEVVDALGGRIPVMVDSGFRRGTDIYKALALGARAVGIGKPYLWGGAAFGQEGIERVLDLLRAELELVMRQCGTPAIAQITRAAVIRNVS